MPLPVVLFPSIRLSNSSTRQNPGLRRHESREEEEAVVIIIMTITKLVWPPVVHISFSSRSHETHTHTSRKKRGADHQLVRGWGGKETREGEEELTYKHTRDHEVMGKRTHSQKEVIHRSTGSWDQSRDGVERIGTAFSSINIMIMMMEARHGKTGRTTGGQADTLCMPYTQKERSRQLHGTQIPRRHRESSLVFVCMHDHAKDHHHDDHQDEEGCCTPSALMLSEEKGSRKRGKRRNRCRDNDDQGLEFAEESVRTCSRIVVCPSSLLPACVCVREDVGHKRHTSTNTRREMHT